MTEELFERDANSLLNLITTGLQAVNRIRDEKRRNSCERALKNAEKGIKELKTSINKLSDNLRDVFRIIRQGQENPNLANNSDFQEKLQKAKQQKEKLLLEKDKLNHEFNEISNFVLSTYNDLLPLLIV